MYHIPYCVKLLNMLVKIIFAFFTTSLKKDTYTKLINVKSLIYNTDRNCRSVLHLCRSDMLIKIYCKFFARFLVKLFCFFTTHALDQSKKLLFGNKCQRSRR